jgi:phage baseplate assembly protein W
LLHEVCVVCRQDLLLTTQGTEQLELRRDDAGSAPLVELHWWYAGNHDHEPFMQRETVQFDSLAALTAAIQAAISSGEHRIRMNVTAGKTASGQQCAVVTRGDHEIAGVRGSRTHVGRYPRLVKRHVAQAVTGAVPSRVQELMPNNARCYEALLATRLRAGARVRAEWRD